MKYSIDEIELILQQYPFSKYHLHKIKNKENIINCNEIIYHSFIVNKVESWLKNLLPHEKEIINLRIFEKKQFNYISSYFNYPTYDYSKKMYDNIIKNIYFKERNNYD